MALSYTVKLSWNEFWDSQQKNHNCELVFKCNSAIYILLHENYTWEIAEYNDETYEVGKVLVAFEMKYNRNADYRKDEVWDDAMQQCYKCLTAPVFNGKSFKDIIESILFED